MHVYAFTLQWIEIIKLKKRYLSVQSLCSVKYRVNHMLGCNCKMCKYKLITLAADFFLNELFGETIIVCAKRIVS